MHQPAAPKAGAPGPAPEQQTQTAQPAPAGAEHQQPPPSMGLLGSPLFLMLLFVPFIFLMWRRNKKETEARAKLKKGDKVIAGGGLVGEISDIDERIAKVKIAPGVTVQVLTTGLSAFEDTSKAAESVKDAKAKAEKGKASEKPAEGK